MRACLHISVGTQLTLIFNTQADGKKKEQEEIHHDAEAHGKAKDAKESVSLKRDASKMFVKSDAMSSRIGIEDRVTKTRDEYAALKKEEAEATSHGTKDSHVTQGYTRRGEAEHLGDRALVVANQAPKVWKEGEWGQASRVGAVRAVDAWSGTEEQGRKLVSEIFPDQLGPN